RRRPWGHLLEGRFNPDLNRATPEQVCRAFAPWFDDLRLIGHDARYRLAGMDAEYRPEGVERLTPALRARLRQWPEEWLITRGYVLQGRKRDRG
ncbi:MAG TPA: hypothetical protein VFU47_13195, partial [Armatimonadota bacterium]|nr:hypothetical protein [Armatimonadota bacterium]